ncbi:hypothetical protein L1049_008861 [Liquidambar formosana]|uniref:RNase H type-1 domain-containing protein n=1 Tax=Liquidambar formosana TaxID=63359 RepID=A0AAP0SA31_LIQFO
MAPQFEHFSSLGGVSSDEGSSKVPDNLREQQETELGGEGGIDNQRWSAPRHGCLKINFDGAWLKEDNRGGMGVVLRDVDGVILGARAINVRNAASAEIMELMAARDGLRLALSQGCEKVELEGNALHVIRLLQGKRKVGVWTEILVKNIASVSSKFSDCSLCYSKKSSNELAMVYVAN